MGESDEQHTNGSAANTVNNSSQQSDEKFAGDDDVEAKLLGNGKAGGNDGDGNGEKAEQDPTMTEEINKLMQDMPLTDDITCGFWIFKGPKLQRFANQTAYVVLYGLVGSIFSMTYAYFSGTITTIEKRFKIPSRNTGIISVGNDISQMMVSAALSYYAGKGHRPRWIGIGLLTIVAFCMLTALPHFIWGPGEDAKSLTYEFGGVPDENATMEAIENQRNKLLCRADDGGAECEKGEGNLAPQVVLFLAQFISGIGASLYYTLGVAYMDDNTKKSKTPALLSLSYFLRMLGPATGYALASFCLRVYIVPSLHPIITDKDPRWLGAWWMGWLIIGVLLMVFGTFLTMFPKQLPRAAARRMIESERRKKHVLKQQHLTEKKAYAGEMREDDDPGATKASMQDMIKTFKRLTRNKTLMYNNLSSVFYLFGYTPYWIFTAKYIEIQYRQSASTSSMVTGTVALAFSAVGVLLSGLIISKFKPRARYMAAWNVIVGCLTVIGIVSYAFIGCPGNEQSMVVNIPDSSSNVATCNSACHCDYVRYSPVCGENNMTYISPCHAGCKKQYIAPNGKKFFYDCSCIPKMNTSETTSQYALLTSLNDDFDMDDGDATLSTSSTTLPTTTTTTTSLGTSLATTYPDIMFGGSAISGACPVNCFAQFVTFLAVMCCMKFFGSTGRATNFLVSVRCVPEKDKTAAMGFGIMLMSMFAFIPSPIFFGWLLDRLCLVWGKTCTNKGNCWLYDPELLRYALNFTAAVFLALGTLFDVAVWYYVKDLKIFDEDVKEVEMKIVQHEEELNSEKKTEM